MEETVGAMKLVQEKEKELAKKFGLNAFAVLGSDEYKELQKLIGAAKDLCFRNNLNYTTIYLLVQERGL